jgi:O-antigen ligase
MLSPSRQASGRLLIAAALLASPYLLAISFSPSSTLLNQLLSVAVWGVLLGVSTPVVQPLSSSAAAAAVRWPLLALASLVVAAGLSSGWASVPLSMTLSTVLMLVCAVLVMRGAVTAPASLAEHGGIFWAALLLAGGLSSLIALIQVFWPQWADGVLIARSGLPGRAVGNVRQPNHLSTLLLWSLIALVPVARSGQLLGWRVSGRTLLSLGGLLTLGVVLTASRTGVVGMLMLSVWGVFDRRLNRPIRHALVAAPLVYLLGWLAMAGWSHLTHATFGGEARLAEADLSASRFGIWRNAWDLILAQPWTGVGIGNFNYAWTLTPFPGRPVAFFDHAHNLPLHVAVEMGLPAALALTLALCWGLWQAWQRSFAQADEDLSATSRAATMVVMIAGVHSLLEYPLWYGYFLLPTAWAFGLALRPHPAWVTTPSSTPTAGAWSPSPASVLYEPWRMVVALLMILGAVLAAIDYQRVVIIYQPGNTTLSLEERIEQGQQSLLFAHHADYAAATVNDPSPAALLGLTRTTHSLLDTRLMTAWADALAQAGQVDQARHLAARLREFRNPATADYFAPCKQLPGASATDLPYQCLPASRTWRWQDFLDQPAAP